MVYFITLGAGEEGEGREEVEEVEERMRGVVGWKTRRNRMLAALVTLAILVATIPLAKVGLHKDTYCTQHFRHENSTKLGLFDIIKF